MFGSARPLGPLPENAGDFSRFHLAKGGVALFSKGARWEEEVASARESWSFDLETWSSQTDPNGVILKITGAKRV